MCYIYKVKSINNCISLKSSGVSLYCTSSFKIIFKSLVLARLLFLLFDRLDTIFNVENRLLANNNDRSPVSSPYFSREQNGTGSSKYFIAPGKTIKNRETFSQGQSSEVCSIGKRLQLWKESPTRFIVIKAFFM